jgi:hypothetical protein
VNPDPGSQLKYSLLAHLDVLSSDKEQYIVLDDLVLVDAYGATGRGGHRLLDQRDARGEGGQTDRQVDQTGTGFTK